MARGVKDLRELICVSRLTIRDSDEDIFSEEEGRLSRAFSSLSTSSGSAYEDNGSESRQNSALFSHDFSEHISPDSGFVTNGQCPEDVLFVSPPPEGGTRHKSKQKKKKRKNRQQNVLDAAPRHDLTKHPVLPPVNKRHKSISSDDTNVQDVKMFSVSKGNFEDMLMYLDANIVANWLCRANETVNDLSHWVCTGENFVNFAHFWLSDFPEMQRHEILKLEYEVLLDELNVAFAVGRQNGQVKHKDFVCLLDALYREYPQKLLSSKGSHLFLDYLDVLTSERTEAYKTVLSDVKVSTRNRQHAQWLLAIRSFALVSSWSAIIGFYRRLLSIDSTHNIPLPAHIATKADINYQRMYQAIRNGHVDVVHFFIKSKKVDPQIRDTHDKTLVFSAVMYNQPKLLEYLLKVKPRIDPNLPADTGNTPLHAASNNGNVILVTALLKTDKINVNCTNPQTDNATPLQLAVMHGHKNVVEVLLCAKADKEVKMGGLTPADIARDFQQDEILEILSR